MLNQELFNKGVVLQGTDAVCSVFKGLLARAAAYPAGRDLHARLDEIGTAEWADTTLDGFRVYRGRYALVTAMPGAATTGDGKGRATEHAYGPKNDDYKPGIDRVSIGEPGLGADFVHVWIDPLGVAGFPAFTTLHHELVHAYHYLSGRRLWYPDSRDKSKCGGQTFVGNHEESQTIGLRHYDAPYTENALRRQAGVDLRTTWHGACER
jgi:hypothetical protein